AARYGAWGGGPDWAGGRRTRARRLRPAEAGLHAPPSPGGGAEGAARAPGWRGEKARPAGTAGLEARLGMQMEQRLALPRARAGDLVADDPEAAGKTEHAAAGLQVGGALVGDREAQQAVAPRPLHPPLAHPPPTPPP